MLPACGAAPTQPESGAPAADEPAAGSAATTLLWWDYYSEANGAAIESQLQRYMDSHPNIKVERTSIPFADLKQKLLRRRTDSRLGQRMITWQFNL
jgi:multiple sugar transport system substrate-binding protein